MKLSLLRRLERSNTWYLPQEIDRFRSSYRKSILSCDNVNVEPCYIEDDILINDASKKYRRTIININSKDILVHRQRRKIITLEAVLEAQRRILRCSDEKLEKDHKLAYISDQFSNWSRTLVRRVGISNYHSAFSDEL